MYGYVYDLLDKLIISLMGLMECSVVNLFLFYCVVSMQFKFTFGWVLILFRSFMDIIQNAMFYVG